ncbi:hypothetical protein EBB07_03190 [Paenibacillaceae bacterium]|nr:hypothetical protein EBB07_03190 [Paenibacillaceae bacterium]
MKMHKLRTPMLPIINAASGHGREGTRGLRTSTGQGIVLRTADGASAVFYGVAFAQVMKKWMAREVSLAI